MTSFTRRLMTAAAVLVLAGSAFGQWRPDDGYYRNRYYDRGYRGGPDVIERVLSHIDHSGYFGQSQGDRRNLDHARNDLFRFRENWYRGKFDKDRLDSAIDHIHHVVDSTWIDPRERGRLTRDLYDLRDFRATRGYGGGYRY